MAGVGRRTPPYFTPCDAGGRGWTEGKPRVTTEALSTAPGQNLTSRGFTPSVVPTPATPSSFLLACARSLPLRRAHSAKSTIGSFCRCVMTGCFPSIKGSLPIFTRSINRHKRINRSSSRDRYSRKSAFSTRVVHQLAARRMESTGDAEQTAKLLCHAVAPLCAPRSFVGSVGSGSIAAESADVPAEACRPTRRTSDEC